MATIVVHWLLRLILGETSFNKTGFRECYNRRRRLNYAIRETEFPTMSNATSPYIAVFGSWIGIYSKMPLSDIYTVYTGLSTNNAILNSLRGATALRGGIERKRRRTEERNRRLEQVSK